MTDLPWKVTQLYMLKQCICCLCVMVLSCFCAIFTVTDTAVYQTKRSKHQNRTNLKHQLWPDGRRTCFNTFRIHIDNTVNIYIFGKHFYPFSASVSCLGIELMTLDVVCLATDINLIRRYLLLVHFWGSTSILYKKGNYRMHLIKFNKNIHPRLWMKLENIISLYSENYWQKFVVCYVL